jgi:hypothetical protein
MSTHMTTPAEEPAARPTEDGEIEPPPDDQESHRREGHDDLPFGDDPQSRQGDDPASGGS